MVVTSDLRMQIPLFYFETTVVNELGYKKKSHGL